MPPAALLAGRSRAGTPSGEFDRSHDRGRPNAHPDTRYADVVGMIRMARSERSGNIRDSLGRSLRGRDRCRGPSTRRRGTGARRVVAETAAAHAAAIKVWPAAATRACVRRLRRFMPRSPSQAMPLTSDG